MTKIKIEVVPKSIFQYASEVRAQQSPRTKNSYFAKTDWLVMDAN